MQKGFLALMSKSRLFSALPGSNLQTLIDSTKMREIRRKHPILVEGKRAKCVYLVLSGIVKVTTMASDPERMLIGLIGPGEVFGLAAFTTEPSHRYRCDAFSDCTLAEIRADKFAELVLGIPLERLRSFMAVTMGRWWWGLPIWYVRAAHLSLQDRLIALLGEVSRKFGVRDSRGVIINIRLTHADLADLLGCTRTKLTTEMNRLQAAGMVIRAEGRIIVPNSLRTRLETLTERRQREIENKGIAVPSALAAGNGR
jgi:CRP-like cAMP-binding protein